MNVYLGIFFISLATLAYEIALTRLLSVIAWYHLAFFAVSTAMLGMTAGATTVYLKPDWFAKSRLNDSIARACLGYSLAIPVVLITLCLTPLILKRSVMSLFALISATFTCTLPFYFSGIAITAVLTKQKLPIGKIICQRPNRGLAGLLIRLRRARDIRCPERDFVMRGRGYFGRI